MVFGLYGHDELSPLRISREYSRGEIAEWVAGPTCPELLKDVLAAMDCCPGRLMGVSPVDEPTVRLLFDETGRFPRLG